MSDDFFGYCSHGVYTEVNGCEACDDANSTAWHLQAQGRTLGIGEIVRAYAEGSFNGTVIPLTEEKIVEPQAPGGSTLPTDAAARKAVPLARGLLDYFPDALCAVAALSLKGNEQHHPGTPLHWDRTKSTDEADALLRHLIDRGTLDTDGVRHTAKVAWRALALLQKELDRERGA